LTTSYEIGYNTVLVIWKSHVKLLLTYNSIAIVLISAPMDLKPRQKSFGTETHHFQPFPLPCPNSHLDIYLAYTLS